MDVLSAVYIGEVEGGKKHISVYSWNLSNLDTLGIESVLISEVSDLG